VYRVLLIWRKTASANYYYPMTIPLLISLELIKKNWHKVDLARNGNFPACQCTVFHSFSAPSTTAIYRKSRETIPQQRINKKLWIISIVVVVIINTSNFLSLRTFSGVLAVMKSIALVSLNQGCITHHLPIFQDPENPMCSISSPAYLEHFYMI